MDSAQRNYLATHILSEQATVSYRSVARALKVHVNAAKRMLYEFHAHENGKRPGSLYATYLLAGLKIPASKPDFSNGHINGNSEDDDPMPSSPPPFTSSMLQSSQHSDANSQSGSIVPIKSIELVREELLEAIKEQYEIITSIHIYSLSSQRLPDLQTLTDIGYNLFTTSFVKEDPLIHNKTHGVIHNSGVRRRSGQRPPVAESAIATLKVAKDELNPSGSAATTSKITTQPPTKKDELSRPNSAGSTTPASITKKPNLKRDASDIFKSFAKAKSKPKIERKDTDGSVSAQSGMEDVKMDDADEGDSEEEAMFLDTGTRKTGKKRSSEEGDGRKVKEDRAAKLRKMMDSDDEESEASRKEDANGHKASAENPEDAEDGAVAWSDSDTERKATKNGSPAADEPAAAPSEPKRRRGRRKVMKKRTMKDEEGYLVTREEAVWESFSEDEPTTQTKPKPSFPTKTSSQQKGSTGGAKGKGGNIMSFFGKK